MLYSKQDFREVLIRSSFGFLASAAIIFSLGIQREGVLVTSFLAVFLINCVVLAATSLSRKEFGSVAVGAPIALFTLFMFNSKGPCMMEAAPQQAALFFTYTVHAVFTVFVPAFLFISWNYGKKALVQIQPELSHQLALAFASQNFNYSSPKPAKVLAPAFRESRASI